MLSTYNIEEWMWGIEDAPELEARSGDAINCRPEQRNACSQCTGYDSKVVGGTEGKQDHSILETPVVVHPFLGVGVPIAEVIRVPGSQP